MKDRRAKPWDDHIKAVAPPLSIADARLKESLVITRLLYDELVINGITGKARNIAGRFLYSQGYQDLKTIVER